MLALSAPQTGVRFRTRECPSRKRSDRKMEEKEKQPVTTGK